MNLQSEIHRVAEVNGFWQEPINMGEKVALIHSEVSELLETLRKECRIIPNVAEELADICIRCYDLAEFFRVDLDFHIQRKHEINIKRPYKHRKRF